MAVLLDAGDGLVLDIPDAAFDALIETAVARAYARAGRTVGAVAAHRVAHQAWDVCVTFDPPPEPIVLNVVIEPVVGEEHRA